MSYKIGDIFKEDEEYYLRASWANNNNAKIEDLGNGQYKIVEIKVDIEELKKEKRKERNKILLQTDKYMIGDYPITEEEKILWIKYRKYLRDLPESAGFPNVKVLTFEDWNK